MDEQNFIELLVTNIFFSLNINVCEVKVVCTVSKLLILLVVNK